MVHRCADKLIIFLVFFIVKARCRPPHDESQLTLIARWRTGLCSTWGGGFMQQPVQHMVKGSCMHPLLGALTS
jgi:hypothetical protein